MHKLVVSKLQQSYIFLKLEMYVHETTTRPVAHIMDSKLTNAVHGNVTQIQLIKEVWT